MKNPASISLANEIPMNFKQRKITVNINKQTLLRLCGKVYDLFAITFVRNECVRCGFSFIIILMVSIFFLVSVSSQYTRFRYTLRWQPKSNHLHRTDTAISQLATWHKRIFHSALMVHCYLNAFQS